MSQAGQVIAIALALAVFGRVGSVDAARPNGRRLRAKTVAVAVPIAVVAPASTSQATSGSPFGGVRFVTDKRAYLDRGFADGITAREVLSIARAGRTVGSCTIEKLGDHEATCVGGRLRIGDTFRVGRPGAKRSRRSVPRLPPVVEERVLETRAALVADTVIDRVPFNGKRAFRAHAVTEVSPGFAVWFTKPDPQGGTYAQERIDGSIRGVAIGDTGLRFDGAFSAVRWQTPVALERFRAGAPTQFYLWEAEASRRLQEGGTTVAVGRLWPFHTPGLTLLDGLQIGRQNQTRSAEAGLYGGLIPTATSLAPSFDIWATGLYGAFTQVGDKKSRVRLARQEARVGVWRGATTGVVSEAEALAQAWVGPLTTGGGGRLRWAAGAGGPPVIERAYVDLGLRPTIDAGAGLHLRYVGATLLPGAPLRAELPMTSGAIHGLLDSYWKLTPSIGAAASAGFHREGETGRRQLHGGAEVRFPRLFDDGGGLWLGVEVEQGWMQGENLYFQFVGHHEARVQVLARLSVNGTRFETPTAIWNLHEVGGYLNVDGVLTSWLRLRAWSLLRAPILVQGVLPVDASMGVVMGLSLAGSI